MCLFACVCVYTCVCVYLIFTEKERERERGNTYVEREEEGALGVRLERRGDRGRRIRESFVKNSSKNEFEERRRR